MSPSIGVSYNYVGFSQFPRPDFHRQDSRPYGLQAEAQSSRSKKKEKKSSPRPRQCKSEELCIFGKVFSLCALRDLRAKGNLVAA